MLIKPQKEGGYPCCSRSRSASPLIEYTQYLSLLESRKHLRKSINILRPAAGHQIDCAAELVEIGLRRDRGGETNEPIRVFLLANITVAFQHVQMIYP